MTIPHALRYSARSAYRDLYRAASSTFSGDEPVLKAFRQKMRADALEGFSKASEEGFRSHVLLTKEIATVLRKNIVQAMKVEGSNNEEHTETWKLRITPDTELGSNDTIKTTRPSDSSRRERKQEKAAESSTVPHNTSPKPSPFYSVLKKAYKQRVVPELREEDLEESFIRGSGPGGQSINKTENNVQLLHKPTGIRVTCQDTRSLQTNRMLARRRILEKLDKIKNPGLSKGELQKAKQRERERQRRKKAKKKQQKKEVEVSDDS